MKKALKKTTTLLLAAATAGVLLSGCGKGEADKTKTTEKAESTEAGNTTAETVEETTGGQEYKDYSNGFPEQVVIQIPVYDRAYANWNVTDNYYTRWMQEQFGDKYNVKLEYVAISKPNQVNDYMQLLAAGKAPDIIINFDMPQMLAYYQEGALQKLNWDEIAHYAPTYWENMSETIETYGKVDGEEYFYFANRPASVEQVALIRTDWLDKVGMDMPENLTELNEVFEAWKEAGLGNGGGFLEQNNFSRECPYREFPMSDEELALYSDISIAPFTLQAEHDYLKNMNYQYNHDLIDKEFYLNIDEPSIQADFISGASGVMYRLTMAGSTTLFDSLKKNCPEAEIAVLPLEAMTPEGKVPQTRGNQVFGLIQGINQDTTDEERIAIWMYLDWMSQPENLLFLQNGIEGINYNLNEEGLPVKVAGYEGESKLSENNNTDYWCLVTNNVEYDDKAKEEKAAIMNNAPEGYGYLIEQAYDDYENHKEYIVPDPLFSTVISSISEYKADLNEKWKELYVKCVMAPEDKFEETYEDACQEYLDSGFQAILDEKKAAFEEGKCMIKK